MVDSPVNVGDLLGLPSVGRIISQSTNQACPNQLPAPGTLVDAFRRGNINETQFRNAMKAQGYGDTAIDAMLAASETHLNPDQLIEGMNRGLISSDDVRKELKKDGYSDEAINGILGLSKTIPKPDESLYQFRQGQIDREQLRENLKANGMSDAAIDAYLAANTFHFDPATQAQIDMRSRMNDETLKAIGISTKPSEEFIRSGRARGMTDQQIKDLWIAQQPLPDNGTIIQQLHKGQISEETARDLLRGKGLSDAAVSELLSAQQTIIPSRTAGTMFMNEGLSAEDLKATLMANGYSEADADKLVAYYQSMLDAKKAKAAATAAKKASTKASSAGKAAGGKAATVKNKDLSLDLIKNAYYFHEIQKEDALGLIMNLDYELWEADLIMKIWDAQLQQKDTNDLITMLGDSFKAGLISETELRDELGKLNLRAAAIEVIVMKHIQTRKSTQKHPSVAELKRWLKKGLIGDEIFIDWMQRLNYPEDVAYLYFREATGGAE